MKKYKENIDKLSETDLKIIEILRKDGRIPISEISKETNIAESTIIYHIKKLHSKKIIRGYIPVLDFNKLGWKVFSHLGIEVEPDKITPVCKKLAEFDQITDVLECSGKFDIIASIYSHDLETLSLFLDQEIRKIPGVKEVDVTPILKIYKLKTFNFSND